MPGSCPKINSRGEKEGDGMERIYKTQHLVSGTDYVVEEVRTDRTSKPDLWIGHIGKAQRKFIGNDWRDVETALQTSGRMQ